MNSLSQLWRTTTVRLTAQFILIFVLASIGLLAFMAYHASISIQRNQTRDIEREVAQFERIEHNRGVRGLANAVQSFANRPGPGIYYLGDDFGRMLAGNVSSFPPSVLSDEGIYTFDYDREGVFVGEGEDEDAGLPGYALVRSLKLESGLRLVVGRDIIERRGFAAIIFQGFFFGVVGIVVLSLVAGGLTAMRVLKRISTITDTSTKIISGNFAERIPVTRRNDEFDRLAENLNAMLDRIEQLMQGLKEVTDNVAHDLKTPLTRLRNKAEAALRTGVSAKERRIALERTIEESDQLIRTFNALLMIARVEAGTPSGALADVDISAAATDVAELYGAVAEDAGMELATQIDPDVHLTANRELIGQALVNLIENAIKYAPADKAKTNVITLRVSHADDRVLIEVADNGPGIPKEDRERVLERFVRLEKSRTEAGSGLGLSLVAAVARLHKGSFVLEDNKPGIRAILSLPADA